MRVCWFFTQIVDYLICNYIFIISKKNKNVLSLDILDFWAWLEFITVSKGEI